MNEPPNLKHHEITKAKPKLQMNCQIMNEHKTLKDRQTSKRTQITNEPQVSKEH